MIQNRLSSLYLFLVFFISVRCDNSQRPKTESNIKYTNGITQRIIKSYLASKGGSDANRVLTFALRKSSDSIILSVANSYPNLKYSSFVGSDMVYGVTVYFIGEVNNSFYNMTKVEQPPKKVLEINNLSERSLPPSFDPRPWTFYFKDTALIGYFPEKEIEKFYLEKQSDR